MGDHVDGVVFGAGGGVGLQCVKHMLRNGQKVRAVVRSPSKYADTFPKDQNLSIVSGGVLSSSSLTSYSCDFRNHCLQICMLVSYTSGVTFWKHLPADVTNVESLKSVLQGAKGAIFAASASSYWSAAAVDFQV